MDIAFGFAMATAYFVIFFAALFITRWIRKNVKGLKNFDFDYWVSAFYKKHFMKKKVVE